MRTTILIGDTGSGKSSYFDKFLNHGTKVIFACKTNKQAIEQHQSYTQRNPHALAVLLLSTQHKLKAAGITPITAAGTHHWDSPILNKQATLDVLSTALQVIANEIFGNPDEFNPLADITFTTYSRVTSFKLETIPGYVVVYDDIQLSDFNYLFTSKKLYNDVYITDGKFRHSVKSIKVGKSTYFEIPESERILSNCHKHHVYFTTVEKDCAQYIFHRFPDIEEIVMESVHNLPQNYHIIGTDITRKCNKDSFAHLIEVSDGTCVADGINGVEINHSLCAGRNDLSHVDIITKISIPHPNQSIIQQVFLDLEGCGVTSYQNRMEMMYNKLVQVMGRNQQNRSNGHELIAFVDPIFYDYLVDYKFLVTNMQDDHPFIDKCLHLLAEYENQPKVKKPKVVDPIKLQIKKDKKFKQIQDMQLTGVSKACITKKLNLHKFNILNEQETITALEQI